MEQSISNVDIILLDIVCPITFVKETLFPYALSALPDVLTKQWTSPEFQPYKIAFPVDAQKSPETLLAHVQDLTARDVKIAYLKDLQGEPSDFVVKGPHGGRFKRSLVHTSLIIGQFDAESSILGYLWQTGYESRTYSTPLFSDVVPNLQRLKSRGKRIAIYSSGSIFAQRLLFAHVKDISSADPKAILDLTSLVEPTPPRSESWFDTTNAGPKTESASYEIIASKMGVDSGSVLFLSDNAKEVSAALEAGMKSLIVDRPGNAPVSSDERDRFGVIKSFNQLEFID